MSAYLSRGHAHPRVPALALLLAGIHKPNFTPRILNWFITSAWNAFLTNSSPLSTNLGMRGEQVLAVQQVFVAFLHH